LASEYLMKKYKDVKPDEPIQLTDKEKKKNWWEYHKFYFLVGGILLAFVISFIWELASRVDPDYQIAFVSQYNMAEGADVRLSERLEPMLEDRNGDGKVVVQVNSYVISETDPYAYAVQVSLIGDITLGTSSVFIVEDLMDAQHQYGIFYQSDGTIPEDDATEFDCAGFAWKDCPALNDLDIGGDYFIAHRGWVNPEHVEQNAGVEALWEVMTAGAVNE